jgi:hypothetical protein
MSTCALWSSCFCEVVVPVCMQYRDVIIKWNIVVFKHRCLIWYAVAIKCQVQVQLLQIKSTWNSQSQMGKRPSHIPPRQRQPPQWWPSKLKDTIVTVLNSCFPNYTQTAAPGT